MTPSEQNRAIAEWMGWTKEKLDAWEDWMLAHQQMQWGEISTEEFYRRHLRVDPAPTAPPNFHGDLNACHDAELKLNDAQWIAFRDYLSDAAFRSSISSGRTVELYLYRWPSATSAERCEALLRTLGLWKEGE